MMNPPFQQINSNAEYSWCSGKVSYAAIFLYKMRVHYPDVQTISILPDVLRSGSRYSHLRDLLDFHNHSTINIYGKFDSMTDVDVFTLDYNPNNQCNEEYDSKIRQEVLISDIFDVHVGLVVPHRDKICGKRYPYLKANNVPTGGIISSVQDTLKSMHKPVRGPFVVVRRTSSPSDKIRCVSSIISSTRLFHLDNHLIFLKPKTNESPLEHCRRIHAFFSSPECSNIINNLIRCRHLTVRIIRNLTYKGGN